MTYNIRFTMDELRGMVTAKKVEKVAKDINVGKHSYRAVKVGRKYVPIKILVRTIIGPHLCTFTTTQAREVLKELEFDTYRRNTQGKWVTY